MTPPQSLIHWSLMFGYLFDYFKWTERYFFSYYQNITLKQQNLFLHPVQFSRSAVSESLWPRGLQHARPPCPAPTSRVYKNSCPLNQWCHPTISSSVIPFSSCLQSFPASGSFPMNQLFASGGQSIGVSASASVLPNEYSGLIPFTIDWLVSLLFKGLSRVFSNITVWKHQFFGTQLSL